ncbi:hypothetical protein BDY21DRAFT_326485, partial [Lineolata rhizophorae]
MALPAEMNKENIDIADGLVINSNAHSAKSSPAKTPTSTTKKSRSKSIGPGGLPSDVPLQVQGGNENRRKSALHVTKSILSGEDETKRREARRKSLANRRVSFAPEATLHTWDVIEYMRDATTSSSASSSTPSSRRQSSATQPGTGASPANHG